MESAYAGSAMMGLIEFLFGKPQEKRLEPWRDAYIEANMDVRFIPERGLTETERLMAEAVIQIFKEMFGKAVFCDIRPSSTFDYKVFRSEKGEVVYGHDLNDLEGPFMVTPDQLEKNVFKGTAEYAYEQHHTEDSDYQHRLFIFKKGDEKVLYYADNKGVTAFCASGLSI
jgi:hypothetical protein